MLRNRVEKGFTTRRIWALLYFKFVSRMNVYEQEEETQERKKSFWLLLF